MIIFWHFFERCQIPKLVDPVYQFRDSGIFRQKVSKSWNPYIPSVKSHFSRPRRREGNCTVFLVSIGPLFGRPSPAGCRSVIWKPNSDRWPSRKVPFERFGTFWKLARLWVVSSNHILIAKVGGYLSNSMGLSKVRSSCRELSKWTPIVQRWTKRGQCLSSNLKVTRAV